MPFRKKFIQITFWTIFLQIFMKNAYNFLGKWFFFVFIFEYIWKFENVSIPCKFCVSSFKNIMISNHNQKLICQMCMFSCVINYNSSSNIMYIIPHLYVVKDFWSSKILDKFWKVLWIFKVLEFHIF